MTQRIIVPLGWSCSLPYTAGFDSRFLLTSSSNISKIKCCIKFMQFLGVYSNKTSNLFHISEKNVLEGFQMQCNGLETTHIQCTDKETLHSLPFIPCQRRRLAPADRRLDMSSSSFLHHMRVTHGNEAPWAFVEAEAQRTLAEPLTLMASAGSGLIVR